MATIRKRQKKTGIIYDIQVKVRDVGAEKIITKTTTFTPDAKMTPVQQERAAVVFAEQFEEEVKKMVLQAITPVDNHNITVRQFGEQWLEKVKRDCSLSYYVKCKEALEDACQYIGGYKVRELNPAIIQRYYDNLDGRKKKTTTVKPKKQFKKILQSYGFNYKKLRYELNIQCNTLCTAYDGGNVSIRWAETLCEKTNVPFDKLFTIIENEEPYAFETIDRYKRCLRAMLAKAKKARLIDDNYASSDYIDFPTRPPREIHCMDDEQAKIFFNTLMECEDIRIKTSLLIFILTGFRRGEVAGLQWKDINFEDETITVSRSITTVTSFGSIIKEPKTETSKRRITMAKTLVTALKEYRQWWLHHTRMLGDVIPDGTDWLFLQGNGTYLNPSMYIQWLRRVLKKAGLKHCSLHSLRHTNITMQIAAGVPMVTVSARAGHARTSTTTDIYAHFIKSGDQFAAQTIDNIFTNNKDEEDE